MGKLGLALLFMSSLAVADKAPPPAPPADKPPAPKTVKQMSRAELEQEVVALRADNARMKAKVEEMQAREKDRAQRLEKALGTPATTLK
jgi:hypothetical protein